MSLGIEGLSSKVRKTDIFSLGGLTFYCRQHDTLENSCLQIFK